MRTRFNVSLRRMDEEEDGNTPPKAEHRSGEISPREHQFAIDLVATKHQAATDRTVEVAEED